MKQDEDWVHLCSRCRSLKVYLESRDAAPLWSETLDVSQRALKTGLMHYCFLCEVLSAYISNGNEYSPLAMWPWFKASVSLSYRQESNFIESWSCVDGELLLFADEGKFCESALFYENMLTE